MTSPPVLGITPRSNSGDDGVAYLHLQIMVSVRPTDIIMYPGLLKQLMVNQWFNSFNSCAGNLQPPRMQFHFAGIPACGILVIDRFERMTDEPLEVGMFASGPPAENGHHRQHGVKHHRDIAFISLLFSPGSGCKYAGVGIILEPISAFHSTFCLCVPGTASADRDTFLNRQNI